VGGATGALAAPAIISGVVNVIGFGASGVVGGSLAAALQGSAVTAGSAFAACQSIGATGSLAYLGGGAIIAVGGIGLALAVPVGLVTVFGSYKLFKMGKAKY